MENKTISVNVNDILALLEQGKSVDTIATEYANAINEALKIQEQKKKENAEKAELAKQKVIDLTTLLTLGIEFFDKFYPELEIGKYAEKQSVDEFVTGLIDAMDKAYDEVHKLSQGLDDLLAKVENPKKEIGEDELVKFLKKNGLF